MKYGIKQYHDVIECILPVAVPINDKHKTTIRRSGKKTYSSMYLSKEYKDYKETINAIYLKDKSKIKKFSKTYVKKKFVKDLHVDIVLHEKDNKRDIDACIKVIFDSLNGKVWDDDSQISSLFVTQKVSDKPHVVVEVFRTAS